MQRLTFAREFTLPLTLRVSRAINPRVAITEFFCTAPRTWLFEPEASSVFRLRFHRGEWRAPRWLQRLNNTWLGRMVSARRPLTVSAPNEQAALSLRPAELTVQISPEKSNRLRIRLDYHIYFAGRGAEIPRDERKWWKGWVDEDVKSLQLALAAARADT